MPLGNAGAYCTHACLLWDASGEVTLRGCNDFEVLQACLTIFELADVWIPRLSVPLGLFTYFRHGRRHVNCSGDSPVGDPPFRDNTVFRNGSECAGLLGHQ